MAYGEEIAKKIGVGGGLAAIVPDGGVDPWGAQAIISAAAVAAAAVVRDDIAAAVAANGTVIAAAREAAAMWQQDRNATAAAAMDAAVIGIEGAIAGHPPHAARGIVKAVCHFGTWGHGHPGATTIYNRLGGWRVFDSDSDGATGASYDD